MSLPGSRRRTFRAIAAWGRLPAILARRATFTSEPLSLDLRRIRSFREDHEVRLAVCKLDACAFPERKELLIFDPWPIPKGTPSPLFYRAWRGKEACGVVLSLVALCFLVGK